jgi:chromosome segregation ATPase
MADLDIGWIAASVAGLLSLALLVRVAGERARTAALRSELDELRKEGRGTRKQQEQRDKALRQAETERDKAERKLAQAETRATQARGAARAEREAVSERIGALESELALANARRDELCGQADAVARELEQARRDLDSRSAQLANADARYEVVQRELSAQPPPADPAQQAGLVARAEAAERCLVEQAGELARVQAQVSRLEGRLETQSTLYTSIRAELAARKDEVRQQREQIERLQAYKVALVDAPAVEGEPREAASDRHPEE